MSAVSLKKPSIDKETRISLGRVLQALEVLRSINHDMPIAVGVAFVQTALNEGLSITELSNIMGEQLPTASRYCQALGELRHDKKPGLQLIQSRVDLMEQRKKILELTPEGRRRIQQLCNAIEGRRIGS